MSYDRHSPDAEAGEVDILTWIFALGFAREQLQGPKAQEQRTALAACGRVLPWVLAIAVLVWAQVYSLQFVYLLAFLEIQALVIGVTTALFIPRPSPLLILNTVVNVLLALLAIFFTLLIGAFVIGIALFVLMES